MPVVGLVLVVAIACVERAVELVEPSRSGSFGRKSLFFPMESFLPMVCFEYRVAV